MPREDTEAGVWMNTLNSRSPTTGCFKIPKQCSLGCNVTGSPASQIGLGQRFRLLGLGRKYGGEDRLTGKQQAVVGKQKSRSWAPKT